MIAPRGASRPGGALREYVGDWSRRTGIGARCRCAANSRSGTEQALLRIAQGRWPTGRHSGAERAHVLLACEDGRLTLEIRDDGRGFDPATAPRGVGLSSMRERAESLPGGRLEVESAPGAGTRLRATCRLAAQTEETR